MMDKKLVTNKKVEFGKQINEFNNQKYASNLKLFQYMK